MLQEVTTLVEKQIELLGIEAEKARTDVDGQWIIVSNFIPVFIDVWLEDKQTPWNYTNFEQDPTVFQISIPFAYAPTIKRKELWDELLTVNQNMHFAKFTFNEAENIIAINYRKPGSMVHQNEVQSAVNTMLYYTEMTYEVLKDEFTLKRVNVEE